MTIAILAGGLGTRLRSVNPDLPKVLFEVGGKPFIYHVLDQLSTFTFRRVVMCTGHLGHLVQSELGRSYKDFLFEYSQEEEQLDTAGALRLALPLFGSDTVLVVNGDTYCDVDLEDFWVWHHVKGSEVSVLLSRVKDSSKSGSVRVNKHSMIVDYKEESAGGLRLVNAGRYLVRRRLIEKIPRHKPVSLELDMIPLWVSRCVVYGHQFNGRFHDIGCPDGYLETRKFFSR